MQFIGSFTNGKERIQKSKETGDSKHIDQYKLDNMSYNMAYWYIKCIPRKSASDKVLPDKTFSIVKSPKYDRYQRFWLFLIKRLLV